jgi:hypothetical protein
MNRRLATFLVFGFLFQSISFSQVVNIPDEAFKTYLISNFEINTFPDDEIQVSEALNYTDSIICVGLEIEDLTGIEAFENITFLSCVNNSLTSLDVSHNLALESLICAMNGITTLDVSNNPALKNLRCSYNPLQTIDVSHNPNLEYLYCENNQLAALDVTHNPELLELSLYTNSVITLDLTQNPQLRYLDCNSNHLNQLSFAENNSLEDIRCNGNLLQSLDLLECTALRSFRGVSNHFTSLDVSNCSFLETFDCAFCQQLTSLDFSSNPAITGIVCFSNQLVALNLANGNNMNILGLMASGNPLTCIQVDEEAYSNANWVGNSDFHIDSDDVYSENCSVGLSDSKQIDISLSPNPATDLVHIEAGIKTNYKLTSMNGEIIKTGELGAGENTLSIAEISSGMYILHFLSEGKASVMTKVQKI